jgi:tuftelin-interacting protein 11
MSTSTADQTTAPRERRSFLPTATTQPGSASFVPKKISKKEQQHFAKLESSGSLGLKMLQKMGWKSGTGLGANEQGIVTPIGEGQKVRDRGKGLSSGERSAGAILEAARM